LKTLRGRTRSRGRRRKKCVGGAEVRRRRGSSKTPSILAVIAKQELIRISERTKAGIEKRRAQGLPVGKKPIAVEACDKTREARAAQLAQGVSSLRTLAKQFSVSVGLVQKVLRERS